MRIRGLLLVLPNLLVLTCLLSRLGFAQTPSGSSNTVLIPTGLNSTINLSSALLAIDDKSPMATSIGSGSGYVGLLGEPLRISDGFRRSLANLQQEYQASLDRKQTNIIDTFGILEKIRHLDLKDERAVRKLFSEQQLFAGPEGVAAFTDLFGADTRAIKNLNPTGGGIVLLNRLLLRDYIRYLNQTQGTNFTDQSVLGPTEVAEELPPDVVATGIYAGIHIRAGGGPTVYTPEAIYSNGLAGFDVAAQAYLSDVNGYAASFRFDLSPGRTEMVRAVSELKSALAEQKRAPLPFFLAIEERQVDPKFKAALSAANLRIAQMQLAVRSSVQFSYRHVDSVGSISSAGVSFSKLFPFTPNHAYNGVTLLFGLQALQFSPTVGSGASTIKSGAAAYWQNRVSRLIPGPDGTLLGDVRRWTTQSGIEYNFRNRLQSNDTYGVFLRQRFGSFTDFTLSIGRDANKQGFVGLSFGKTFF